jgi:DNA-binding NarL/FixJ family response regulator
MGQIRILLVDDHSLFRESLSRLLEAEPDLQIVGNSATATEALAILDREQVDIVLLDYDLGDEQGSIFLNGAKKRGFEGRILMVTAGMSDVDAVHAFESGSAGIFLKHSPPTQLVEAIHRVMRGEVWLEVKGIQSLISSANGRPDDQRTSQSFNTRERAVLKAVFEGFTNKEIAAKLEVSESSVKAVLQQLFDKTGVRTRSQLVRIALESRVQDWLAD